MKSKTMSWKVFQDYQGSTDEDFERYEELFTLRYVGGALVGLVAVVFLLIADQIGGLVIVGMLSGLYVHIGGTPKLSIAAELESNTRWLLWKNKKLAISLEKYEAYKESGQIRSNRPLSRSWIVAAPVHSPNLSTP